MYRYKVDNAVTYTPDDIVLFRESPFAIWMERLTLENPDHGILPDMHGAEPADTGESRDHIVATLRAEGRNVVLIDRDMDEPDRRTATLAAMRGGADFIVNGQLAVGALSGNANLLMRTSGYSQLGDFLYIPCETQARTSLHSAFRLSFVADLLHSLQGQLPPQMLIISDGADVVPLQTEDYIYYYRAVQQRFAHAMITFRKHRMPDPAESSHFGRWSECACEVLKQRALREQLQAETTGAEPVEMPQMRVAGGSDRGQSHYDTGANSQPGIAQGDTVRAALEETSATDRNAAGHTLAEQARLLAPDSYRNGAAPGHTPNLARFGRPRPVATVQDNPEMEHNRRSSDAALQNLEFIGSNIVETVITAQPAPQLGTGSSTAPAPNLRDSPKPERAVPDHIAISSPACLPELEPRAPLFLPPDQALFVEPPRERLESRTLDIAGFKFSGHSVIDMDSAPAPSLTAVAKRPEVVTERPAGPRDPALNRPDPARTRLNPDEDRTVVSTFSSSLITSEVFNDR
jgi:hypothetical protein